MTDNTSMNETKYVVVVWDFHPRYPKYRRASDVTQEFDSEDQAREAGLKAGYSSFKVVGAGS